jgi:hypothetical protein
MAVTGGQWVRGIPVSEQYWILHIYIYKTKKHLTYLSLFLFFQYEKK